MNEILKRHGSIHKNDFEKDEGVSRIQDERQIQSKNILKCDIEMIRTILKALHMYHSEAWHENEQSTANEILKIINEIKDTSKWDHEDDKHIGQIDNPINKLFTKCIEGANCDT